MSAEVANQNVSYRELEVAIPLGKIVAGLKDESAPVEIKIAALRGAADMINHAVVAYASSHILINAMMPPKR
jgi:hypothetical protein